MLKVIGPGKVVFEPSPQGVQFTNTGKVKIGCAYIQPPRRIDGSHEVQLQTVLIGK